MNERGRAAARRKRTRRTTLLLIALTALGPAIFQHPSAAQEQYAVVDLMGPLHEGSEATAINIFGQVVVGDIGFAWRYSVFGGFAGGLLPGEAASHALLWRNGLITDLGTLSTLDGPHWSSAMAINTSGQVAGWSQTNDSIHAFRWTNGVMTDLGTLGGWSLANGINDAGDVVGSSTTDSAAWHAFLWRNGVMTDLGTLGGLNSFALGINAFGQVVGNSETASGEIHAFLWQSGVMVDLGTLGGWWSTATAINDRGQIVGASATADGVCITGGIVDYHAFLWETGAMHDLGTVGCSASYAVAINNSGEIVGNLNLCDDFGCGGLGSAFLYKNGLMTGLNDLIPNLGLWSATGINDLGQIIANGPAGPYRLDPPSSCATPDPFVSLGGGLCWNGGWLPPGMLPPRVTPTPPAPTPPPSSGSCATPDPFISLGGGTCWDGGWLPPGMAPPSVTPTPAPTPAPVPTPPPPPSRGCTTPDPFVAVGGGTCVSGGWLPPGIAPPTGSPTPAPPTSGGCTTPDPFVSIPGLIGVCINGGWIPVIR